MHKLWRHLRDDVARDGRAALVSVLAVEGSTPREAGARMIVSETGLRGTIGGGALEHEASQSALHLLREDRPKARLMAMSLGPDLGQCCGGRVTLGVEVFSTDSIAMLDAFAEREDNGLVLRAVFAHGAHAERIVLAAEADGAALTMERDGVFIERFHDARTPLYLFGAGHVGTALVMALAPLPFRVIWFDERADAFPRLVPENAEARVLGHPDELHFPADAHVLIMTHSHPLDLALVATALRSPARFIGLIGSASKKARFLSRLRAAGFSAAHLQRIACPIGMAGIDSKEPAAIAASVAAQMLVERERATLEERQTRPHHARVPMGAAE